MVVMDTNYAAPRGSREGHPGAASPNGMVRAMRWSLLAALLVQVALLYLYVPTPSGAASIPHADKVVHAAIFAAPALLGVLGGLRPWLVALVLAVHAPVSEMVQHYLIPGRFGDPVDMLADWAGIGIGLVLGLWLARRGPVRFRWTR